MRASPTPRVQAYLRQDPPRHRYGSVAQWLPMSPARPFIEEAPFTHPWTPPPHACMQASPIQTLYWHSASAGWLPSGPPQPYIEACLHRGLGGEWCYMHEVRPIKMTVCVFRGGESIRDVNPACRII